MKKCISSILAITSIGLVGCSSSPLTNYQDHMNSFIVDEDLAAVQSIDTPKVMGFKVMNDQHISITSKNKHYLLTTPKSCQGMFRANKIVIANHGREVVQANIDQVVRLGDKYTECTITGIYKLHLVQLQRLTSLSHNWEKADVKERS